MHWTMMRLEARDKRALILGALAATLLLAFLLWPSGSGNQSNVELVAAGQRQAAPPPAAPVQIQPAVVAAPAPPPAAVPEGLRLHGVTGGGAIFAFGDGAQRFIPRGREVAPGLRLQGVALRHVVLATTTASFRLGFGGVATPLQAPAPPAAPAGGPAPNLVVPGAPANAMGGPLVGQAQLQQMSREYVAGLEPRRSGDRITGWTIKPGADLMGLNQAGLQPGDVLISVNGEQVMDQEQVAGLPQQIANSSRVDFIFERNGQRMTRALQVNPRR
jgi:hypothetical protein